MNIFRYEFRSLRGSLVLWLVALSLLALMFISLYPAFSSDMKISQLLVDKFPPFVRDMFGISLAAFASFLGFYAYTFTYITLAGAVQAMNVGVGLLSREDSAKTTDFLFTKPVTRTKIFLSKLAAGLCVLVLTSLGYTLIVLLFTQLIGVGEFDVQKYLVMNAVFFGLQVWFMALGLLVSQLVKKVRSIVALSLGWVFGFFVIGLIGALIGNDKIRYITPFKYFDYLSYVMFESSELRYLVVGGLFIIAATITSYIIYTRRDVRSVT